MHIPLHLALSAHSRERRTPLKSEEPIFWDLRILFPGRRSPVKRISLPATADLGGRHHLATVPRWPLAAAPTHVVHSPGLLDRAFTLIRAICGLAKRWSESRSEGTLRSPKWVSSPPPRQPGCLCDLGTAARWWIHRPSPFDDGVQIVSPSVWTSGAWPVGCSGSSTLRVAGGLVGVAGSVEVIEALFDPVGNGHLGPGDARARGVTTAARWLRRRASPCLKAGPVGPHRAGRLFDPGARSIRSGPSCGRRRGNDWRARRGGRGRLLVGLGQDH